MINKWLVGCWVRASWEDPRGSWGTRGTSLTCSPLSSLPRHFYAAAHLLCLPSLLAQRLRGDATIWRQNVLSGGAWTWATWELDAGRAREGCRGGWWLCWLPPCSWTRCICPILTKSNTEILRFTAEKWFLQQGSQVRRSENNLRFAFPKAKGLRYL